MDLSAILEALNDPQMRHAAYVHMPIVLSMVGALLAFLSALWMGKNATLRWVTFGTLAMLIIASRLAVSSGEEAEGALSGPFAATEAVSEVIEEHERMAHNVWQMALGATVLVGVSMLKKKAVRVTASWLAVGATGFIAAWVGMTAHHGGTLVYAHGAGAPANRSVDPGSVVTPVDPADADDATEAGEQGDDDPGGDSRLAHFRAFVKPVLEEHCIKCHNPTRKRRAADLDQTTMTAMLEGGFSGPAIIPGNPEESWIIIAVRHEQDFEMPPKKDRLPDEVIAALEQWVRDGAVWEPLGDPPAKPAEQGNQENSPTGT